MRRQDARKFIVGNYFLVCYLLTFCILGNLSSADFFQNQLFRKILAGIPSNSLD